jgi:hypothetical protein
LFIIGRRRKQISCEITCSSTAKEQAEQQMFHLPLDQATTNVLEYGMYFPVYFIVFLTTTTTTTNNNNKQQ